MLGHPWVMPENLLVKLAPDQLIQPGLRAFIALRPGQLRQQADGHGAKAQMRRQIRRPLAGGKIPQPLVVGQPALKIRQRRLRAADAGVIFSGCAAASAKPSASSVGKVCSGSRASAGK